LEDTVSRCLYSLGRLAARRPLVVIAYWLTVAVAVVAASALTGVAPTDATTVPGSDSRRAIELLDGAGADQAGLTARVVMTPRKDGETFATSPSARAAASDLQGRLARLPKVRSASDPLDAVSSNGRVAVAVVQYPVIEALEGADLRRLTGALADARASGPGRELEIEAGGDVFFALSEPEGSPTELVGVAVAALILLVAFGSVIAMGMPILLALFGLAVGISALPLVGHLIDVPTGATMIAAMVGLGVGIDYALLLVSRHREHLAQGLAVDESVGRAVATAGRSVVFAGGVVLVSITGLAVAGLPFVTAFGIATSVVVALMVAASITLLPAMLGLVGTRIDRFALRRRPARLTAGPSRWERWGRHVTRHPRAYLVVGATLLVALAAPALALRMGVTDDGTLPQSRTERKAYDLVASGFGPGANGPAVVAVDLAGDPSVVGRLRDALAADPGIASVDSPSVDSRGGIASIVATPTTAPQDRATRETLARLRERVIPAALGTSPARAHVGGQTAVWSDMSGRVQGRLPWFVAAVVGLSLLLLAVVFRSVLVPIKAAVLNLLSIGAAYGVLVAVFQWGWGGSLIGLESTVPIVSFIPLFMFAIVFGLSMDYEVFLLSRVREHYLATGDNDEAIVRGLTSTARVITSAAMIMVAVFLGFVGGSDPTTKMFGLGLATAILVDATVVRMVLVPATMKLLGSANWWLPGWMDRRLPGAASHQLAPSSPVQ
jgi:RND superfamily putative drug exporter